MSAETYLVRAEKTIAAIRQTQTKKIEEAAAGNLLLSPARDTMRQWAQPLAGKQVRIVLVWVRERRCSGWQSWPSTSRPIEYLPSVAISGHDGRKELLQHF